MTRLEKSWLHPSSWRGERIQRRRGGQQCQQRTWCTVSLESSFQREIATSHRLPRDLCASRLQFHQRKSSTCLRLRSQRCHSLRRFLGMSHTIHSHHQSNRKPNRQCLSIVLVCIHHRKSSTCLRQRSHRRHSLRR